MKTLLSFAVFVLALCPSVYADYYRASGGGVYELYVDDCSPAGMRRSLDNATAARRAVITSVKCAIAPRPAARQVSDETDVIELSDAYAYADCAAPIERVIDRRVYVQETVQQYRPVVRYMPAGTYTRMRPACNECDM